MKVGRVIAIFCRKIEARARSDLRKDWTINAGSMINLVAEDIEVEMNR
jgi:hypothetical protein